MKRITWEKPNGEWGVEGASISNAPLPIYNALERLLDYERLGLDPDELARIDKMYAEKCRELAEVKKDLEKKMLDKVCIGCGFLKDNVCTYSGSHCNVSKPIYEDIKEVFRI